MAHIDVFQHYDNLMAAGVSEAQAKEQARALNSALDGLVTKEDLKYELNNLESKLESKIDSKFNILFILGGLMFLINTLPMIEYLKTNSPTTLAVGIGCIVLSFGGYIILNRK